MPAEPPEPPQQDKVTWRQTVGSVLASFFGVQSSRNRARDFQRGSAPRFIAIGVIATTLFVLTVLLVVRIALRSAGM
ncbi:MAG: DUF2970 domain-containing protein [Nevskia sp.]|nr:DUF2970 domain-containing protein [Nevskia sp.]